MVNNNIKVIVEIIVVTTVEFIFMPSSLGVGGDVVGVGGDVNVSPVKTMISDLALLLDVQFWQRLAQRRNSLVGDVRKSHVQLAQLF